MPTSEPWLLFSPPPAAADVAIEELIYSQHKCTFINHIFLVPRLATHLWRKKLYKASNIVIELPLPGARPFWLQDEHEPLLIGLTLHFSCCAPWQLRQSPPFWLWARPCKVCGKWKEETNGLFCTNYLHSRGHWKPCDSVWCGSCYTPHPDDRFHRFVARDESGFEWCNSKIPQQYQVGRDGNHLVTSFQCDDCVFLNPSTPAPFATLPKGYPYLMLCPMA